MTRGSKLIAMVHTTQSVLLYRIVYYAVLLCSMCVYTAQNSRALAAFLHVCFSYSVFGCGASSLLNHCRDVLSGDINYNCLVVWHFLA